LGETVALRGTLIGESLRVGAALEGVPLRVDKIWRVDAGDEASGQPLTWTLIEFDVADDDVDALATVLSDALDGDGSWYCDFRSAEETFVVFAGRVFRYPRGDRAARRAAEEHARSVGVPERQIDWPE
jgi:hypothetical protein